MKLNPDLTFKTLTGLNTPRTNFWRVSSLSLNNKENFNLRNITVTMRFSVSLWRWLLSLLWTTWAINTQHRKHTFIHITLKTSCVIGYVMKWEEMWWEVILGQNLRSTQGGSKSFMSFLSNYVYPVDTEGVKLRNLFGGLVVVRQCCILGISQTFGDLPALP